MREYTGWLFDLYPNPKRGITIWLLSEDGKSHSFEQEFSITFYVGGPIHRLHQLCKYLKEKQVVLSRTERDDLYSGRKDVLKVEVPSPSAFDELFKEIQPRFPDLSYYDVDIPLILRYAAEFNVFPLAYCKVEVQEGWNISHITALDTPWELDPKLPNLRILHIQPDTNPAHAEPKYLLVEFQHFKYRLSFEKSREILGVLNTLLNQYNPDVILTSYGDTWLFTRLEELSQQTGIPFNPNRDLSQSIRRKKAISFHNYGQAHFRGEQVHLYGRWHIDNQNCMTFGDYGLMGAIEQARVTGLPIQEIARRSPGAGIAAMQTLTAMRRGILIPYQQQKGEVSKTYDQLFVADRGGLVFEPLLGIYPNVAIIDFISMYPSIMVEYNISPETVGVDEGDDAWLLSELNVWVSSHEGLVPATLKPMVHKRVAIKRLLKKIGKKDERYAKYQALANALKWLCVVAYGRLGFANSTFGRINSHEAVTHIGRKMILRAKEIAEDHGFTVLHIYVDSVFIYRTEATTEQEYQSLLDEIERETKLPIEVEEVYSWMAFVSARHNPNLPVANRFFGLQPDGEYKVRGLALRREDTPIFVSDTQQGILKILANEKDPTHLHQHLPEVLSMVREKIFKLSHQEIPLNEMIVTQTLSRELDQYRVPSPAARAALQLQTAGKTMRMGQRIQFIYTKTKDSVRAWDLPDELNPALIDLSRYKELLFRAVHEVLQPMGIPENVLRDWMFSDAACKILDIAHRKNRLELLPMDKALRLFLDPLQASG
ncbi:MAG: DNA polymerase domain-containing protein [Anaerolineales bacterium]